MIKKEGLESTLFSAYRQARMPAGRNRRIRLLAPATLVALVLACFTIMPMAHASTMLLSKSGVSVRFQKATGQYKITARKPAWSFGGSLGSAATDLHTAIGRDPIGAFREITFTWKEGDLPLRGVIRLYQHQPLLLFRYTYLRAASPTQAAFPRFTQIPAHLDHFSYRNHAFAPPQFKLGQYGTPWLFFDGKANAMVISPASHFIISVMRGDGDHLITTGLDQELSSVPAGFSQQTLMAIAPGIRHTWDVWGKGLTGLAGKKRPGIESDPTLKYYGYWTDHGAIYYYKYIKSLGYEGTLQAVISQFRKRNIPVGYLQLDSWWYPKSYPGMSAKDPIGKWTTRTRHWNGRGGTMLYQADHALFPQGLKTFQQSIGLPLMTHGRWISTQSPYRGKYKFSGVAPIGMAWWNHIASYLHANGVMNYEQDWQSYIYKKSPAFQSTINTGAEFYNHMAEACRRHGLTMQYCMAMPCDFLQGSHYGNLTSIRVSDDHFIRARWKNFLYTSQFAYSIGTWPWTDVYMSDETDNILLGALSAGPVGTGDALGKEDRANIMKTERADGVLVKPDVPIMPLDRMYIAGAKGSAAPFIADTWTRDGRVRTGYVFAFSHSSQAGQTVSFRPAEVGIHTTAYVYDYFKHQAQRVAPGASYSAQLGANGAGYFLVAPVAPNGIALFGDHGKFITMGKQRMASLSEKHGEVKAEVLIAANGGSVTLFGESPTKPQVTVRGGQAAPVAYTHNNGSFSVQVTPDKNTPTVPSSGKPVRQVTVIFKR